MKILSIKTSGFRKFADEFSSNFYENVTYIFAGNHKGKTNILFAIIWALLGSNLTGDEKVSLIHKDKSECYVELVFTDNNDNKHTIIRYKNKYDTGKNFLTLDGKIAKQEDLVNFYFNKSLFLSIINLSYFVNMQPAKQKELVDKYLPDIDIKDVYSKLSEDEQKLLGTVPINAKLLIKDLDDEIKFMEQKITTIKGKIEYADKIASENIVKPAEFSKEQELSFAIQELDNIKNNKEISNSEQLKNNLQTLEKEELELTLDINKLEKELQEGKKIYQSMINSDEVCCPTCKQHLDSSSKVIASKKFRENLMELYNKQVKLKERYNKKHFDVIATKGKIYSLENANQTISPTLLKELENNVHLLELEKQNNTKQLNEYNAKLNTIQNAKTDIESFNKEIQSLNSSIEETKTQSDIAKKLYFNSVKEKMNLADKYLKDVKIRFYKVLKTTGEIKDDFVITYKDKDFSLLSKSEKIATSLEIANMFNKITKLNSPFFIDDSESYPDFDFLNLYNDTQIFIARVKKGRALRILSKEEKINGYISDKNYIKKAKAKQLVCVA